MKEIKVNFKAAAIYLNVLIGTMENFLQTMEVLQKMYHLAKTDEEKDSIEWDIFDVTQHVNCVMGFFMNFKPCILESNEIQLCKWAESIYAKKRIELDPKYINHPQISSALFSFVDSKK